jgi:hypothetical protein
MEPFNAESLSLKAENERLRQWIHDLERDRT